VFYDSSTLTPTSPSSTPIVDQARVHLLSLIHTLEAVRKSSAAPNFVFIYQVPPTEQERSLTEAHYTASLALIHAYSTSYRIPIKVARVGGGGGGGGEDAYRSIVNLFPLGGGVAEASKTATVFEITAGPPSTPPTNSPTVAAARLLVYGSGNWVGSHFIRQCKERGIPLVEARSQPGVDPDPVVAEEIDSTAPSHVVYLLQASREDSTEGEGHGYLNGEGPGNLRKNMQLHFYSAWTLGNMCVKRGVHYTYLGTNTLPELVEEEVNRYSVVEKWAERTVGLLKPVLGGVLRARVQFPFSAEGVEGSFLHRMQQAGDSRTVLPGIGEKVEFSATDLDSCIPVLVEMVMRGETGRVDLVNPGPVTVGRVRKLMEGRGAEVNGNGSGRNGCVMGEEERKWVLESGIDRLCVGVAGLPCTEECIKRAVEGLRKGGGK